MEPRGNMEPCIKICLCKRSQAPCVVYMPAIVTCCTHCHTVNTRLAVRSRLSTRKSNILERDTRFWCNCLNPFKPEDAKIAARNLLCVIMSWWLVSNIRVVERSGASRATRTFETSPPRLSRKGALRGVEQLTYPFETTGGACLECTRKQVSHARLFID